ncbi:MAG: retron St85 family RNA-directed DNA polymerase [Candidatus Obscuribacterales bacterium]|nr:retron St85 family RNA-directed DNA polymerase [Candidatus Obscuribacterales bacterium]
MTTIRRMDIFELVEQLETSELHLRHLATRSERFYREFVVAKKSGGGRKIVAPSDDLKDMQKKIAVLLLNKVDLHEACTGYRNGKSIIDNAQPHVGQHFVLNMDLKDFFPSISSNRVTGLFYNLGWERPVAMLLARITTYKGSLPQGAPSSPAIANLLCRRLDTRLSNFSRVRGWQYTRYCDDLTISGQGTPDSDTDTIYSIIESEGFTVNLDKTRTRFKHQRQVVTGIVVNQEVRIPREQRRLLRAICHQMSMEPESFRGVSNQVLGQLSFAQMVEGQNAPETYRESAQCLLDAKKLARQAGATY